ncbi:glycosyltransferase involved in cell wall biosynthesis [Dysgonomonas sp. PH5-45]|uniref:glycosyltransferase n=1 Tax=unclassified Dysgonomonas TaxID=2630389 RepID=UPI002475526E|nr:MULTISPECIES: glycosyltransferase [unclassified Dysgonomonas]MDH6355325.1 glycosyltransferase involved in cell wall biosynthesis [Dysgonomonas sp. PH5-45]MDH6388223.1 glycosyltransferase involved in cell wall biosynthesis [Dysgonomonas sp. PH5-37]
MKRISVIFCTYNREKYIYKAIKSIVDQNYDHNKYEILLINNNSTDRTGSLCKQAQLDFKFADIRYFEESNQGLSYARNRGIEESLGEIVVFVDDDATAFEHTYLSSIDDFFAQYPDAGACGGPIIPVYEADKPGWLSHFTEELIGGRLYKGTKIKPFRNGKFPGGGNSAYRKEIFDKYGLFNVDLGRKGTGLIGAEEKDLYDRLRKNGVSFYYLPQMGIHHYISAKKLTGEHFKELTYSIGKSERIRTKGISDDEYKKRVRAEYKKWVASLVLFVAYTLTFSPQKGYKLLQFRWNVSRGLMGK